MCHWLVAKTLGCPSAQAQAPVGPLADSAFQVKCGRSRPGKKLTGRADGGDEMRGSRGEQEKEYEDKDLKRKEDEDKSRPKVRRV